MKKWGLIASLILLVFLSGGCSDGKCDKCGIKEKYLYELSGKEYCFDCYGDISFACTSCGQRGYYDYEDKNYCNSCYTRIRLQAFDKIIKTEEIVNICNTYKQVQFIDVAFDMTKFAVPTTVKINGFEKLSVAEQFSLYEDLKSIQDLSITLISDNAEYKASTSYNGYYKKITKNGTIIYEYPGDPKETAYQDLTIYQKYVICQWIDGQYKAYDKMAGYDTGDKYTKSIFLAAAEEYNKTYDQINTIWSELFDIKTKLGLYNN